jgi:DNA-binding MltR family transcriptional regulator
MKVRRLPQNEAERNAAIEAAMNEESPRGKIIVLAEMLNVQLAELLLKYLRDSDTYDKLDSDELLGRERPLSSFSARIAVCYRLGLISQTDRKALDKLREFRNVCAHECATLCYDEQRFQDNLKNLVEFIAADHGAALMMTGVGPCPVSCEEFFLSCAGWLSSKLNELLASVAPAPKQFIHHEFKDGKLTRA